MDGDILTPIWTGDIDKKSSNIQSTNIIGSIRWWTESILRALNYSACNPSSGNSCPIDTNDNQSYCSACWIFGATGLRRCFRLEISQENMTNPNIIINIIPGGRNNGWFLGHGITGKLTLSFIPLNPRFKEELIFIPLAIISNWGALGAKSQLGYGVVNFIIPNTLKISNFVEAIKKATTSIKNNYLREDKLVNCNHLPNIRDFFFLKIQFNVEDKNWWHKVDGLQDNESMNSWVNSSDSIPIAPAIKNWLRFGDGRKIWNNLQGNATNRSIETWIFGSINKICSKCYCNVNPDKKQNSRLWCRKCRQSYEDDEIFDRVASKINISNAYCIDLNNSIWEFRIWGWIPTNNLPDGFTREPFLDNLKAGIDSKMNSPWIHLLGDSTDNHKLIVWREFNSSRDTINQFSDIGKYLQSLIGDV